ncbi:Rieske (2Fe-2S) protein [Streptomyces sp. CAU 1734]|uniref:Rieske (2Fe-2S) protein n=1 Tax=Streptomyces sp. CAU 1734 TaxID=3140360 RepID=UPI0032614674
MTGARKASLAVGRRAVVAAAGGAGLAAALTACGGTPGDRVAGSGPADGDRGDRGDEGGGAEIAKVADIPEGGGKVVGDVVITQPAAGRFKAFSAKCTHQGCAVRGVAGNVITCPCHNSTFDADDGSVTGGPASAPLPPAAITVEGDSIRLVR